MGQTIYFGDVEVYHKPTNATIIIGRQVFIASDNPADDRVRKIVLSRIKPAHREEYKIVRFCIDTAKIVGETVY